VKESRFDPAGDLLIVHARVWGPRGGEPDKLRLAIDTGATHSLILPDIIDELGHSPRDGEAITTVRAALGKSRATCCG
jgi:predicted aspartyl protease